MSKKVLITPEEIYQKIEEIYQAENGKKFISHLIKSFFPTDKALYIFEKKDKPIFCCISGIELVSKEEVMQMTFDTSPEEFGEYMKKTFTITTEEEEKKQEQVVHPVVKKLNGRILGVESAESDKYICKEVHQQLYNFYANHILHGD